eukprot:3568543-Prymnesium_polylepis.1
MATKKVVYIIRHGESVWNAAQRDKDAVAMLSTVDHPLNEAGRDQAEGLQASLRAGGAEAAALMASDAVMCSPLTRAIETCLIGLQPMLTAPTAAGGEHVVVLNPNLREKRNFGGKDSSGQWVGEAIVTGVHAALDELYRAAPERAAALNSVELELSLARNKWWLGSKESGALVAERIDELFAQARRAHAALSLAASRVAHLLTRAPWPLLPGEVQHGQLDGPGRPLALLSRGAPGMCAARPSSSRPPPALPLACVRVACGARAFAVRSEGCTLAAADGTAMDATQLDSKKLSNAGVIRCELDFEASPTKPIVATQLCFATTLID